MSDDYKHVTFMLRAVWQKVFLISKPHTLQTLTLPRSLIHGADEMRLSSLRDELLPLEGCTARIFAWKAKELGL